MTASVMGSRSLQGRIVKSRTTAVRNASKSKDRNSLEVLDEDDPDYISPVQLQREKRSFIQNKVKQLKKDKKYGFKLSEIDQKVTKAQYGDLVDRLKKKAANPPDEKKCNFCEINKLQDYRIPMQKMNKLFLADFIKCKERDKLA